MKCPEAIVINFLFQEWVKSIRITVQRYDNNVDKGINNNYLNNVMNFDSS